MRQGKHGEELGRLLLQAVADAGGDVAAGDEEQLASAARDVPAQRGDAVDPLLGVAVIDLRLAAQRPTELQTSPGELSRVLNGCFAWPAKVSRMRSRKAVCSGVSCFFGGSFASVFVVFGP